MLVLPLHQLSPLAAAEVGSLVQHLQPILQTSSPVIPGVVIPISTLRRIAQSNDLEQKVSGLLTATANTQQIATFFKNLRLPPDVAQDLLAHYHQWLADVAVISEPSWVRQVAFSQPLIATRGDANVIESMLEMWGHLTWAAAQQHSLQPWLAAALVLRPDTSQQLTITIASKSGAGDKTAHVVVTNTSSAHSSPDNYEVDVRTMQITQRELSQTLPLITDETIISLTEKTYQAKRMTIEHLECTWQLWNRVWVVTECHPISTVELPVRSMPPLKSALLIQGNSYVRGQVTGPSIIVPQAHLTLLKLSSPSILITTQLHQVPPQHIRYLLGVICEQGVDPQASRILQEFQIPTIIQAPFATRRISPLQKITLDAEHGTVRAAITSKSNQILPPSETAVIAWQPRDTAVITSPTSTSFAPAGYVLDISHLTAHTAIPGQSIRPLTQLPYTWMNIEWSPTHHSSQLQAELSQLARAERYWPHHPHLLSPALHASVEATHLLQQLTHTAFETEWPLWWLVSTPENLLKVEEYLALLKPRGVVIDIIQVAQYLTGIEFADRTVAAMYQFPWGLLTEFLSAALSKLAELHLPVFVKYLEPTAAAIEFANHFKLAGVMVTPYYVGEAYQLLARQSSETVSLWQ